MKEFIKKKYIFLITLFIIILLKINPLLGYHFNKLDYVKYTINIAMLFVEKNDLETAYKILMIEDIQNILKSDEDLFEIKETVNRIRLVILFKNKLYTKCLDEISKWLDNNEHRTLMLISNTNKQYYDKTLCSIYCTQALCYYRLGKFYESYEIRNWLSKYFNFDENVISIKNTIR